MTFQPVLPMGGYGGWQFLKRTMDAQQAQFARSPVLQRDAAYFRERIGQIDSAEALVSDPRLLRVALGAFGLEEDVGKRFLVRKILEGGTEDPRALANRLTDRRYQDFARSFGFGDSGGARTGEAGFADRILGKQKTRQFEVAVGNQDNNLRLALNLRRELTELAGSDRSERAKWFSVLGTPPLRQVFETAFGLPQGFGTLDIDRQLGVLQGRARQAFGSEGVSQFTDPDTTEKLIRQFLLRAEVQDGLISGATRGAAALQLLQTTSFRPLFAR